MCVKKIKLKVKIILVFFFFGFGGRSNKKELGYSMQYQSILELKRNI